MNVTINTEQHRTKQQTVSFSDQNQQWLSEPNYEQDNIFQNADLDDAKLEDFFKRPIRISTTEWTVGQPLTFTTINPWSAFFENTRIINRIVNFKNLRCNLKVKIVINGNGFHYGRALASYRPLHNLDKFPVWRSLVANSVVPASQRLHVWLDPTKSQGGTLTLPFVWQYNALSIPDQEWREMGELDIGSVVNLTHANGGTDKVAISVFVWAEDVHVSVPTSAEPGSLAPQAGKMDKKAKGKDEYDGANPISGPANAIAKAAGMLESVPVIGGYATATKMAAGTVGKVASALGLSRPVDNSGICSYKPSYTGNMANTNVPDTSNKLTYDVKQELTIDPSAVGMGGEDEMDIKSIAGRESYLTQFNWAATDASDAILWSSYVTPSMNVNSGTSPKEFFFTPMGFVSAPFKHWRGSIKYRFQIVASSFHKGRIKVVWDPHFNNTSEYNVQYTHVIDLASERDFTVEVAWGQPGSFLEVPDPFQNISWTDNGLLGGPRTRDSNGTLSVYAVNKLTSPGTSAASVQILVSVSAGDDFEVVNPTNSNIARATYYVPLAGGTLLAGRVDEQVLQSKSLLKGDAWLAREQFPQGSDIVTNTGETRSRYEDQAGIIAKKCQCGTECIPLHCCDFCPTCGVVYSKDPWECQAGELDNPENDSTMNETSPISQDVLETMGSKGKADETYLTYFGDPVPSIRNVLKRYCPHSVLSYDNNTPSKFFVTETRSDFPFYKGYAGSDGMHLVTTPLDPTPYNFARNTMVNWFTPAFLTRRGGIRWKYLYTKIGGDNFDTGVAVARLTQINTLGSNITAIRDGAESLSQKVSDGMAGLPQEELAGSMITPVTFNPTAEIEIPFFSPRRFAPARERGFKVQNDDLFQHVVTSVLPPTGNVAHIQSYVAAAEDYTLAWFQCVPSIYQETTPVPSAS